MGEVTEGSKSLLWQILGEEKAMIKSGSRDRCQKSSLVRFILGLLITLSFLSCLILRAPFYPTFLFQHNIYNRTTSLLTRRLYLRQNRSKPTDMLTFAANIPLSNPPNFFPEAAFATPL